MRRRVHIGQEFAYWKLRTLCGIEEETIRGELVLRKSRTAHTRDQECKRCRELYEKQSETTDTVWFFVDFVFEGRQGAARGGMTEPLEAAI